MINLLNYNFFGRKSSTALSAAIVVFSFIIVIQTIIRAAGGQDCLEPDDATADMAMASIINEPDFRLDEEITESSSDEITEAESTEGAETTENSDNIFATAVPVESTADYKAQFDEGYLIAIDNPDFAYKCGKINLCDEDRNLLERLCMGEFGSGGMTGAALIAQAVKNALYFDGFKSVQDVIECYHYSGRTDLPASFACRQAVRFIFDENRDAVQHRLLYMYNPKLVESTFHESQNYILTYQDVRFFDRW